MKRGFTEVVLLCGSVFGGFLIDSALSSNRRSASLMKNILILCFVNNEHVRMLHNIILQTSNALMSEI